MTGGGECPLHGPSEKCARFRVPGSGAKPYRLKNVDDSIFSCSCPAWANQGKTPPAERTCKHLKAENGADSEARRVAANCGGTAMSAPVVPLAPTLKTSSAPRPNEASFGLVVLGASASASKTEADFLKECTALRAIDGEVLRQERPRLEQEIEAFLKRKLRQDEKAKFFGPPVLLANDWWDVEDLDPAGWWMSEKLDGVRAYWDGKVFESRQGNIYMAPAWFTASLPKHPLDGELWMARSSFQKTISIVKTADAGERWRGMKYVIFDAPHLSVSFEERMSFLAEETPVGGHIKVLEQVRCNGEAHMLQNLAELVALGAEGIMLRKPGSSYEKRRSSTLLKVKQFHDAEATVVGHEPGKKQHKGKCGGLILQMPNGKTFNVNAGKESTRQNPPPVGTVVTYRYTELTVDGIPKCASYVCKRDYE